MMHGKLKPVRALNGSGMPSLATRVREILDQRRGGTGKGFVVVLGSAPRERGAGVKHGVGRSAVADALAEELGAERLSTGKVFRDMASDRGLSIEAFHRQIPDHPEWDADLDRRVVHEIDVAKDTGRFLVLDSNLAALLGKPDLAVRIDVPDAVRAERVQKGQRYGDRSFSSPEEVLDFLDARSEEERERYRNHPDPLYEGVDIANGKAYRADVDNAGPLSGSVERILGLVLELLDGSI